MASFLKKYSKITNIQDVMAQACDPRGLSIKFRASLDYTKKDSVSEKQIQKKKNTNQKLEMIPFIFFFYYIISL